MCPSCTAGSSTQTRSKPVREFSLCQQSAPLVFPSLVSPSPSHPAAVSPPEPPAHILLRSRPPLPGPIGALSFSELQQQLAALEASEDGQAQLSAAHVKGFLERTTKSQVTPYGVKCLMEEVPDRQICVFYRGGRFHTAFKREGAFFLLCNDPQLADDPTVVWEQMQQTGATNFANAQFQLSELMREAAPVQAPAPGPAKPKVRAVEGCYGHARRALASVADPVCFAMRSRESESAEVTSVACVV